MGGCGGCGLRRDNLGGNCEWKSDDGKSGLIICW